MATYAKIRRLHFRDGLSISDIARRTSHSRNTIKRYLKAPATSELRYQRATVPTKLTPFEPQLVRALQTDAHRPRKERRTAMVLFAELKAAGFDDDYSRVTEFIRAWRREGAGPSAKGAFVPLQFALGEAFQFDWSEESLLIGGIYDNMRTAVDRVLPGKERIVNARFHAMTAHYLFDADFCNVASGWEKGVVEKNVQDRRRQLWQDARREKFASFGELNAWLEQQCRKSWGDMHHPDYPELTLADVLQEEQARLMPFPGAFDGYVEVLSRVSSTCLVTFQRNRYSVPCQLANQVVSTRVYPDRIVVHADQEAVASHARCFGRDQVSYDWLHYLPLVERKSGVLRNGAPFAEMPEPLQALRREFLRHPGGDRVMAKVLNFIPTHGLEEVCVAVGMALASGTANPEHVLNVLGRLRAPPPPETLDTALRITEVPVANSGRYDTLRGTAGVAHEN